MNSNLYINDDVNLKGYADNYFGLSDAKKWFYFKGKQVVVTGAGTGFGRALVIALLVAGANVYLLGRRHEKLVETIKIAHKLTHKIGKAKCIKCDITDSHQLKSAIVNIQSSTTNIDILINCAAISASKKASLYDSQESRWDNMLNTNLKAQWAVSKEIFKLMENSNIARVLFFTSGAGWADTNGYGLYNISKAALNSLSMSMAKEYQERFPDKLISINCINPGEAKTEMNATSSISPYVICRMVLTILSTQKNIPNGCFFHRDGRHLRFCDAREYQYNLE